MDAVITPQPHFVPGYTGHCPQYRFRQGKTYGKLTHKLLVDPCTNHAPELIVTTSLADKTVSEDLPTKDEVNTLLRREHIVDVAYHHPLIPGYDGFVPNIRSNFGKRFLAAATAGVAEHETLMERYRCERRNMAHRDVIGGGRGVFKTKLNERLIPLTKYRGPLIPVRPRSKALKLDDCTFKKEKIPYSKDTVPHFMEDDDEEKYIKNGYCGHVPNAMMRYGETNHETTHNALCEFTKRYYHRISAEWCPMEMAGIGSMCPNSGQFVIYHRTIGMIPKYAGHVPGEAFKFGRTFGNNTIDAKRWLALHRE